MAKKKLTGIVIDALEDIKAKDIRLVNVMKITSVFDYIAVACGDSNRQTKALANNVMEKVKEAGYQIYGIEGEQTGEWVLVDCGDVVVHIMQPAIREYYQLEELWSDGEQEFPVIAPKRAKAPAKPPVKAKTTGKKPAAKRKAATGTAKKPVATGKTARKKPAATARKKPATAVKKPATAAKKPVAKKPAARRRKAAA